MATGTPIRIRNLDRRRPFPFSLYHKEICVLEGACFCLSRPVALPGGHVGETFEPVEVRVEPNGLSESLPASVAGLSAVKNRIRQGLIRIEPADGLAQIEVVNKE